MLRVGLKSNRVAESGKALERLFSLKAFCFGMIIVAFVNNVQIVGLARLVSPEYPGQLPEEEIERPG